MYIITELFRINIMKTSIQFSVEELQELEQLEVVAGFGGPDNVFSSLSNSGCLNDKCTINTYCTSKCHLIDSGCGNLNCTVNTSCK